MAAGALTFGLDVDTGAAFSKSIAAFGKLRAQVDKTASSQVKGAQAGAKAMFKNEQALHKIISTAGKMRQALIAAGGSRAQLSDLSNALGRVTKTLTNTKSSAIQSTRAIRSFGVAAKRAQGQVKTLGGGLGNSAQKGGKFNKMMRNMESASVLAVGPLSGLGARVRALSAITSRATLKLAALVAVIAGGVVAFVKLGKGALSAALAVERITAGLTAGAGSAGLAAIQFQELADFSSKMGLNLKAAGVEFGKLSAAARGTKLEGQGVKDIFEGVAVASVALRLTQEQTTGAFRALQQMISKGTVQAEELRGQLAERLPGAFGLAAKAMGVTTKKLGEMLKKGEILAEDLLPKLAAALKDTFGKQAQEAAEGLQSAIERLSTETLLFNLELDKTLGISSAATGALNTLAASIAFLKDNMVELVTTIAALSLGLVVFFARALKLIALGKIIATAFAAMTGAAKGFSFALLLIPGAGILAFLARVLPAILAATGAWFGLNAILKDVAGNHDRIINQFDAIISTLQAGQQVAASQIKKAGLELIDRIAEMKETRASLERSLSVVSLFQSAASISKAAELRFEIKELTDQIKILEDKFKLALKLTTQLGTQGSSALNTLSKAGVRVKEKIDDLNDKLKVANLHIKNFGQDVVVDPNFIGNLIKAKDLLQGMSAIDLSLLDQHLAQLGFSGTSTADSLAQLIGAMEDAADKAKAMAKAFKDTPKILRQLNIELDQMRRMTEALGGTSQGIDDLNNSFAREDAIEKYRLELEKMTQAGRDAAASVDEFTAAFDKNQAALKRQEEVIKPLQDAFESGFTAMGDSIADAFLKGELSMKTLEDALTNLLGMLVKALFQLLIVKPLMDSISGGVGGFLTGLIPSAKGNVFQGGTVKKFARGGIIGGPTAFPMSGGKTGIAGEAGPEAIMPLKRNASGQLGIASQGGAVSVTNNFYFPPGTNAREFADSRSQIAAMSSSAMQSATARTG